MGCEVLVRQCLTSLTELVPVNSPSVRGRGHLCTSVYSILMVLPVRTTSQRSVSHCFFFLLFVFRETSNFSPNSQTFIINSFCVIFLSVCSSVCLFVFHTHAPMYKHTRVYCGHTELFFSCSSFSNLSCHTDCMVALC